jgi:hypothetical protein
MGTNSTGCTEWERDFDPKTEQPRVTAKFEKQRFGATVAQIHETAFEAIEVQARNDGKFVLTVHNRRGDTDLWDDMSVTLGPKHFEMLGSIANQRPMSEKPSDISDIFGPKVEPPSEKPIRGIDTDNGGF